MAKIESELRMIVSNPRVQGGEPVIRGTRVPVRSIVIATEEYRGDLEQVGHAFSIDVTAVHAALEYYHQHEREIQELIEKHERAALS